jgi:hypothetical protein
MMLLFLRRSLFYLGPSLLMFALGGFWNSGLMGKYFAAHAPAIARPPAEVRLGFIVVAYGLLTALMAFLFLRSFPEKPGVLAGFQFGALFGLIMTLPAYLLIYAAWDVAIGALLVDALWHGFEQGVGGGLMAVLLVPKISR